MTSPMEPATRKLIRGFILHAGLGVVLFLLLFLYVPTRKKTLDEFGIRVSTLTLTTMRASNYVVAYWWMAAPGGLVIGALDFGLLYIVRNGRAGRVWTVLVALMLAVFALVVVVAMELPMLELREGLKR